LEGIATLTEAVWAGTVVSSVSLKLVARFVAGTFSTVTGPLMSKVPEETSTRGVPLIATDPEPMSTVGVPLMATFGVLPISTVGVPAISTVGVLATITEMVPEMAACTAWAVRAPG
jgi:hypothetical protein